MALRTLFAVLLLALALVAASCGGDDDDGGDATATWASGFCSAVVDWTESLGDVTSQFTDTANLSEDGLQSAAEDIEGATTELVDELRGLGAPDTDSGQEIESALDSLTSTLDAEAQEIQETVEGISGLTGLPAAISTVTASLSAMGEAFASTLQTFENADVGGELQAALEDSPDCANLTG